MCGLTGSSARRREIRRCAAAIFGSHDAGESKWARRVRQEYGSRKLRPGAAYARASCLIAAKAEATNELFGQSSRQRHGRYGDPDGLRRDREHRREPC